MEATRNPRFTGLDGVVFWGRFRCGGVRPWGENRSRSIAVVADLMLKSASSFTKNYLDLFRVKSISIDNLGSSSCDGASADLLICRWVEGGNRTILV